MSGFRKPQRFRIQFLVEFLGQIVAFMYSIAGRSIQGEFRAAIE